ncbi:MAG: DUF1348 family protein [Ferruginibacter sp.]
MTMKLRPALCLVITAFIFAACSSPDTAKVETKTAFDMDKAKTEIQAMEDAFAAGEKAKDAKAVAAYYSDDAISYNRNREPTKGRAAIQDSIAKDIAKDTSGNYNVYKVVDLFGDDNMVVEVGSWNKMNASGTEIDHGHYMSCFQKRDGKYQCVRDMSVASTPAKHVM